MRKLKIAYLGTPHFSALLLEKLITDTSIKHLIEVKFVLTQEDKPVGKRQTFTPSPVKEIANSYKLKVYDQNVTELKEEIKKLDFVLIYAYGFKQFIPANILSLPKIKFPNTNSGFINIHPSLLPLYRGASPIVYPLILGDKKTGVTIFVLDERMDHGPILAREEMDILPIDMRIDLEKKLTDLGYEMFRNLIIKSTVSNVEDLKPFPQDHMQTTRARYLTKEDGFIELSTLRKALGNESLTPKDIPKLITHYYTKNNITLKQNNNLTIFNLFRGLHPWPGVWTLVVIKGQQKRLKITDMSFNLNKLTINKVQLEGKNEVDFKTFNSAYSIF